ncbi:MAG: hypothetical protein IT370_33100 [Deltaproteobacteria bacterium]|nr:hypothetical protein [Deltaproteobacteria bacterium]
MWLSVVWTDGSESKVRLGSLRELDQFVGRYLKLGVYRDLVSSPSGLRLILG